MLFPPPQHIPRLLSAGAAMNRKQLPDVVTASRLQLQPTPECSHVDGAKLIIRCDMRDPTFVHHIYRLDDVCVSRGPLWAVIASRDRRTTYRDTRASPEEDNLNRALGGLVLGYFHFWLNAAASGKSLYGFWRFVVVSGPLREWSSGERVQLSFGRPTLQANVLSWSLASSWRQKKTPHYVSECIYRLSHIGLKNLIPCQLAARASESNNRTARLSCQVRGKLS